MMVHSTATQTDWHRADVALKYDNKKKKVYCTQQILKCEPNKW